MSHSHNLYARYLQTGHQIGKYVGVESAASMAGETVPLGAGGNADGADGADVVDEGGANEAGLMEPRPLEGTINRLYY
jgi:hypothetical protein